MQSTCYIVTSCHGNDDEMWSTSCLIMQHKPYIVELSFMETQESNDSINEGPLITMEGPSQTNAVLEPLHDVTQECINGLGLGQGALLCHMYM